MTQARDHVRPAAPEKARTKKAEVARESMVGQFVRLRAGDNVTDVPVTRKRYGAIHNKRAALGRVIAGYADAAAKAERTGKAFIITHRISPSGKIEVVREDTADPGTVLSLSAALARARLRGAEKATAVLKRSDMLTAKAFGELIGASHETVNSRRKRHELLGLEGATRGVRYPRWQVTAEGLPLPGLPRVFEALGTPWAVYRFLRASCAELGGLTALDALKAGEVDAVVRAAANTAGTFG